MRTAFQALQRTGFRTVMLVLGAAAMAQAMAWSSQASLLFEPVHQNAIRRVLGGLLPEAQIEALRSAQTLADQDLRTQHAHLHAMAGVLAAGDRPNRQQRADIARAEVALAGLLGDASTARRQGDLALAMARLGAALHLLADATAPAHRCFQPWDSDQRLVDQVAHVWADRITPADTGSDSDRARLDAAVRWGYDLYVGDQPLPERFFDPVSGDLLIPASYGVQNAHQNLSACSGRQP